MDIRQLEYFVKIVEEGNISKASRALHISQPPLSYQLNSLENELNTKLLERGARAVKLTEAGKILYKRALNILELERMTKRELYSYDNSTTTPLSIGTVSSSGFSLLTGKINEFNEIFPQVRFEIHEGNTYQLIDLINSGIIELAVVRTPFNSTGFACLYLKKEPMVLIGKKGIFNEKKASLGSLSNYKIILYRRFETIINNLCQKKNVKLDIICINEDSRTTLNWAKTGIGVGIVPKSVYDYYNDPDLDYQIIDEDSLYTQITIIYPLNTKLSVNASRFIEMFQSK